MVLPLYVHVIVQFIFVSCCLGLRHVKPYYFTFTTHAKGRWVGSKVIDVFSTEFQAETPEYYVS